MAQPIDLSLVDIKDIINELVKRHDGLVIAGIKFTTISNFVLTKHWGGNHFVCLGILEDMKYQINRTGEVNFIQDK